MKYFLAQVVLAARDNDIESWTNILFVVVMAIFWALGGILKAKAKAKTKANKTASSKGPSPKEQEQRALRERRIRALWGAMGFEEPVSEEAGRPSPPVQQQKMVRPQPTISKPTPKKQAIEIETPVSPKIKTTIEEVPQTEYLTAWSLGEILRDYEDTERLRRAILHYEILGKPVSLRRLSEEMAYL